MQDADGSATSISAAPVYRSSPEWAPPARFCFSDDRSLRRSVLLRVATRRVVDPRATPHPVAILRYNIDASAASNKTDA
jgi:hypothetical protein